MLSIDKEGKFFLNIGDNTETAIDEAAVLERASAVIRRNPQIQVLVKADQAVPYGRVVLGVLAVAAGRRAEDWVADGSVPSSGQAAAQALAGRDGC